MSSSDLTAEDADNPAKADCLKCQIGNHAECLWMLRPTSCACLCDWLEADVTQHFPSLRET